MMLKIHGTIFSVFLLVITSWAQTDLPTFSTMDYVEIGNTIKLNGQSVSANNLKDALKDSEKVVFDININNGQSELLVDMLTLLIDCNLPAENYSFKLLYSNPRWERELDELETLFGELSRRIPEYYARIDTDGTLHYFVNVNEGLSVDKVPDDRGIGLDLKRHFDPDRLLEVIKKIGPKRVSSIGDYFDSPLIKVTPKLTPIGDAPPINLNSVTTVDGEEICIVPYKPIKYVEETGARYAPVVKPPPNPLQTDLIEVLNQKGLDNERVKVVLLPYVFGNEIRLFGSCTFHQELDRTPVATIDGETVYRYSVSQSVIPICERLSPDNNTAQHTITLPDGEKYELEIIAAVVDVRGMPIPAYKKSPQTNTEEND